MKTFGIAFGSSPKFLGFHFDKETIVGDQEIHKGKEYWHISIDLGWFWISIDDNQWLLTEAGLGD